MSSILVRHFNPLLLGCVVTVFCQLCVAFAAPKTGPDRAFTSNWRVVAPAAPNLRAAAVLTGAKRSVVVGDAGTILISDDAGRTWHIPTTAVSTKSSLDAVGFSSALSGVVVGDEGTILLTHNGGEAWTRIAVPGLSVQLRAVTFTDSENGIIVGDAETILKTSDGGREWKRVDLNEPVESTTSLRTVSFRNKSLGLAVGEGNTILLTTDGGTNWSKSTILDDKTSGSELSLSSVLFVSDSVVLAAGKERVEGRFTFAQGNTQTPILRSEDGGRSWRHSTLPPNVGAALSDLKLVGEGKVFAAGSAGTLIVVHAQNGATTSSFSGSAGAVLSSEDGGATWEPATSVHTNDLKQIVSPTKGSVVVIGDGGLWSADEGATWTISSFPSGVDLIGGEAAGFVDDKHGFVAGNSSQIFWTEDSGKSFQRSLLPRSFIYNRLNSVTLIAGTSNGIAVGSDGYLQRTDDGGKSWHDVTLPQGITQDLNFVRFANSQSGLAIGNASIILRTNDGGRTWERTGEPPPGSANLMALTFFDGDKAAAVGEHGTIVFTNDSGKSWKQTSSNSDSLLKSVACGSSSIGVAVGDKGVIVRTEDGGEKWLLTQSPSGIEALNDVRFTSASHAVAVGAGINEPIIIWTDDSGKTWQKAKIPAASKNLTSIAFSDATNGVAVGTSRFIDGVSTITILWTSDGGKIGRTLLSQVAVHRPLQI
jgi:photosystem II stability/assembly factor-like uncharacterized protein